MGFYHFTLYFYPARYQADRPALNQNVCFFGPCYDEFEIGMLIYNAALCVSPGNVGLTAIHSLSYGTPVISHNDFKHQMPEFEAIVPGETGAFFIANDLNSLEPKS